MTIHKVMYAERTFSLAFVNTTDSWKTWLVNPRHATTGNKTHLLKDDKIVPCHRSFYRIH